MRRILFTTAVICFAAAATVALARYAPYQQTARIVREDCIGYNTEALEVIDEGERGWLLTDDGGRHRMLLLNNNEDAEAALALAKRHRAMCFIGRDNRRPNRRDYIVQYWK